MESNALHLTSPDAWARYEENERLQRYERQVQDYIDNGWMTQEKVLERYTDELTNKMTWVEHEKPEYANLKRNYVKLCDAETKVFSETQFRDLLLGRFRDMKFENINWSEALSALFDLFLFHTAFPFPLGDMYTIDEGAFMRGTALLTLEPPPYLHPNFECMAPNLSHNFFGFDWGPHSGDIVTQRGKEPRDFRRRLFRSLANRIPLDARLNASQTGHVITVPVIQFFYYNESGQEVVVNQEEDERCIDIQDVLSEVPPDQIQGVVATPPRVVYGKALQLLPHHKSYLHELCVRKSELIAVLEFLRACNASLDSKTEGSGATDHETGQVQPQDLEELISRLSSESIPGYLGWKQFDELLADKATGKLAESLSNVFLTFKKTLI